MRHLINGKKLNRDFNHRQALLKNLVQELVWHEKLETTETKAKLVIGKLEKMLNKAKTNSVHIRRQLIADLFDKKVADKIMDDLILRYKDQSSGYVKVERLGKRRGDNTMIFKLNLKPAQTTDKKDETVKV